MTSTVIEYRSASRPVSSGVEYILDAESANDIRCVWSGIINVNDVSAPANFCWKFDWEDIVNKGIERLTGHIIVIGEEGFCSDDKIEVNLSKKNNIVRAQVDIGASKRRSCSLGDSIFAYKYYLVPRDAEVDIYLYEYMFAPSKINDAVLVVEGKKLHVNKTFLSIHSDFFRGLFSSNFMENQLAEIPIEEVSYEDFVLLLICFYPIQVFPTDQTVHKLQEMARRCLVPSVTRIVEYHLMKNSHIENETMMWLADEYGLEKRLELSISQMNNLQKAKSLQKSPDFEKLSEKTRAKLLTRLLSLI